MKFKIVIATFFFLFILVPYPSPSEPSEMGMGRGMGMRQWRKEPRCWRALDLNLSSEQAKNISLIQDTYLRDTQVLWAQLITKRLELRELLTNPATRMEFIRHKHLEMSETQSKIEEKIIEYLIKVRNLLTQEQLKSWCPEQEFPLFHRMTPGQGPMGPMHPKRILPSEE